MSFFTHLECSVPCGRRRSIRDAPSLCCAAARRCSRATISTARGLVARQPRGREPNMWRYRELMPLFDGESR
jgi:hypothetical protein